MPFTGSVQKAQKEDISSVAAFLEKAALIHRHLDWRPTLDWLGSQPFLLYMDQKEIHGLLAAVPDPPGVAWLHCFAASSASMADEAWTNLYDEASAMLLASDTSLYAIGLEDWFYNLLIRQGFASRQNIVVLVWNHHMKSLPDSEPDLLIRPMIAADLDEVALVDARSFEKQWVNSKETIEFSFVQSQHSSVAEIGDQIVGYELTTANQYSAHLARLAVLPEFQHRGIARQLVTNMLRRFSNTGVLQITVNTQSDNDASLHLYNGLGFELTGETYPVFVM
jgi:ribosomal protein S18 acetylase RimI-like enzyme